MFQHAVTVAVDGPGAHRALEELLSITGIVGEVRPAEPPKKVMRDGGVLAAIGAIVGIVGGVSSIVSAIIEWREKWKQAHESQRLSVVIEDANGNRISLDRATPEQITAALQTLQA
jgi:hypothetical protein